VDEEASKMPAFLHEMSAETVRRVSTGNN